VGEDQRQHIELTRDIATRFNSRYGDTFVVPEAVIPPAGARIMDLQHPENKMSKSDDGAQGTILLLDDPSAIHKKFKRAVTDSDGEVRFDPTLKPGVSNLLSILGAAIDRGPEAAADGIERYGDLKEATAEAVIDLLRPLQARYHELAADPAETGRLLALGAEKARTVASATLDRMRSNLGLLPR
jgi:tryptophanyl-tRNA synthetase